MFIELLKDNAVLKFNLAFCVSKYILLDVLLCSIAEYFYESKYKQRV